VRAVSERSNNMTQKLILDLDTGIDDALAAARDQLGA
jgi:hypothetical protein